EALHRRRHEAARRRRRAHAVRPRLTLSDGPGRRARGRRMAHPDVVNRTTAPLPGTELDELIATYIAPSGPWAIAPASGSMPPPKRASWSGRANGIRTTSPGGP